MIRYITSSSHFVELKRDGYIRPSDSPYDYKKKDYVVFEKDWKGDGYFKAMFIAKNSVPVQSFSPYELIALIFDEHDLLLKGYQIHELVDSNENSELKSMMARKELSEKEYGEIGELISIKNEIPLSYMVNVDIPDAKRLEDIGLGNI